MATAHHHAQVVAEEFGGRQVFGGRVGQRTDAQVDITAALALGVVNNKVDVVAMKVDIAGAAMKAGRQATIDSLGMALQQGYVNLHLFGLISLV